MAGGLVGIQTAKMALLDDNGVVIKGAAGLGNGSGIYEVNATTDLGVAQAALSGLTGTMTPIYGSNVKTDVSIGSPAPQVAITFNALDVDVKFALAGYVKDTTTGGYTPTGKGSRAAVLLQTNLLDGSKVYFGFGNGIMTEGATLNLATDNANQTRQNDVLTLSANATAKMPVGYKVYISSATGFSESAMMAEVFGATTPAQQAS